MNKNQMKNVRIQIIGLLATFAIICACTNPSEESTSWLLGILATKGLAALFGASAYYLFKRWNAKGLLPEIKE